MFPQNWKTFYCREECTCNPVRYFAILSMQRSGSGWFETLLNSHVNVSSNGEIFSVKHRRINISSIVSTMDRVYNLDWFTSASKNECSAAVGFKWMMNQVSCSTHTECWLYELKECVQITINWTRHSNQLLNIPVIDYSWSEKQLKKSYFGYFLYFELANKCSFDVIMRFLSYV